VKIKLIVFLIKILLPVEPENRKAVLRAVFGDFHLHRNPKPRKKIARERVTVPSAKADGFQGQGPSPCSPKDKT